MAVRRVGQLVLSGHNLEAPWIGASQFTLVQLISMTGLNSVVALVKGVTPLGNELVAIGKLRDGAPLTRDLRKRQANVMEHAIVPASIVAAGGRSVVHQERGNALPMFAAVGVASMQVDEVPTLGEQREPIASDNGRRRYVVDWGASWWTTRLVLAVVVERNGRDLDAIVEDVAHAVEQRTGGVGHQNLHNGRPFVNGRGTSNEEVARLRVVQHIPYERDQANDDLQDKG